MIILDSSVLIEVFRKKNKQNTLFYQVAETHKELAISAITHYEVGIGNRKLHAEYWELMCNNLEIIPFDESCSKAATKIYHELREKNQMIDLADLFIGATARAHNLPVATLNVKHFQRINKLAIIKNV